MKKILLPAFCILLSVILLAALPTEADSAIYEDTVRLHILAASDSAEHQAEKLMIRDRLLEKYSEALTAADDSEDAETALRESLEAIEEDCNIWLSESGSENRAKITLEEERFYTRDYGDFSLPSGKYLSLRIEIGAADGQNWWCVMYPPLCLDVATETKPGYSDEEERLISGSGYAVRFKLLEAASYIFDF